MEHYRKLIIKDIETYEALSATAEESANNYKLYIVDDTRFNTMAELMSRWTIDYDENKRFIIERIVRACFMCYFNYKPSFPNYFPDDEELNALCSKYFKNIIEELDNFDELDIQDETLNFITRTNIIARHRDIQQIIERVYDEIKTRWENERKTYKMLKHKVERYLPILSMIDENTLAQNTNEILEIFLRPQEGSLYTLKRELYGKLTSDTPIDKDVYYMMSLLLLN